jgi:large subunit ribosomal protein L32
MAVPKRKKSKAMRDHRRAQWMRSTPKPTVGQCPRCQEPKTPHRVCANCGYYGDKAVLPQREESAE